MIRAGLVFLAVTQGLAVALWQTALLGLGVVIPLALLGAVVLGPVRQSSSTPYPRQGGR